MPVVRDLLEFEGYEMEISSLGIDVPSWIEQDITVGDCQAIEQGGCASGAYMPAVTYHLANATMASYGNEVLQAIEDGYGELPPPPADFNWHGIACHYLSIAVEMWASQTLETPFDEEELEN